MMIYLLRHGAASDGYPDSERALSLEGREEVRIVAEHLKAGRQFQPQRVWHSPYRRAVETMEILMEVTGLSGLPVETRSDITPEDNPSSLVDVLGAAQEDLLVVGHNPYLSILISLLLGGERSRVRIGLATSAMVCLEWAPSRTYDASGPCTLNWMLSPQELA